CSVLLVLVLLSVFATVPSKLFAQSATTGLISGTVTDPSGAIVAGASVTLSQRTTNATQSTLTDSAGRYVFPAVNPSDYTLTFSAKGFENAVTNELHVEVLKSYTINITLQVGAASQTVTVTDVETAELQTTSATVGAVLGGVALEELPVFTRSASALMFYQPAVWKVAIRMQRLRESRPRRPWFPYPSRVRRNSRCRLPIPKPHLAALRAVRLHSLRSPATTASTARPTNIITTMR